MLAESLEYLAVKPDGRYLDCTAGLGGHTKAIAALLTQGGKLIANDRDAQSLEMARANTAEFADRIEFQHGSFSELAESESGRVDRGPGGEPVSAHRSRNADFHFRRKGRWICAWIKARARQRPIC